MPSENIIRDKLSQTLEVLEPGLTLVEANHKLPNDVGAKGFIDILARDKFGNLVIIELKRSDQAARQALFEILKYMPLFRRLHGIPAHRIRCFIVSTTWHELLVPYSEFRRLCETQTEGFSIKVDANGKVLSAERVADHAEEAQAHPFRMHVAYLYPTAAEREKALPMLRSAYATAGAEGYLQLHLGYKDGQPHIIYSFGAYFVTTQIQGELLTRLTEQAIIELGEIEHEPPDDASIRQSVEDSFLAIVQESIGEHFRTVNLESTIANPETFTAMVEGGWEVESIERVGPFASPLVMPDADVIEMVKGHSGDNTVRFGHLGSPQHKLDWAQARSRAVNSLRGNPIWQAGFDWFLDFVEKEFPDGTSLLQVYNPLMLPESLYRFAVQGTPEYVPQLALMAVSADGTRQEGLVGTIVWDGKRVPSSLAEVFTEGFCDDVPQYYLMKTVGTAWELDQELVKRHGLEYSLWQLTFGKGKIDKSRRMGLTDDGQTAESPDQERPVPLTDYFEAARPYLEQLFTEIDGHVGRP